MINLTLLYPFFFVKTSKKSPPPSAPVCYPELVFRISNVTHVGNRHNVKNEIPDQVRNDNLSLFASPLGVEGKKGE
jgi:hypothetical protein